MFLVFLQISGLFGQSGVVDFPSGTAAQPISPKVYIDPSKYPKVFAVAPSNPTFNANYDLSKVPKIATSKPAESINVPTCPQAPGACSWACDGCVRKTDILQCTSNQDFGLSYDDGPSESTPKLLSYLWEKSLKATFFVVGSQIVMYPDILKQEFDQGHHIVVHTWSHRALTSLTNEQILAELEWTAVIIQDIIGVRPTYFRPPFGDIDDRVRSIAAILGLKPVLWNYDTSDWKLFNTVLPPANAANSTGPAANPEIVGKIAAFVSTWRNRNGGVICIEHDLYPATAAQAPFVIEAVRASGMNLKTVAQCVGDLNPYVAPQELKPVNVDLGSSIPAQLPNATANSSASTSAKSGAESLHFTIHIFIFVVVLSI